MSDRRRRASDRRTRFEEVRRSVTFVRNCAALRSAALAAQEYAGVGEQDRCRVVATGVLHVRSLQETGWGVFGVEDLHGAAVGERLDPSGDHNAAVGEQDAVDLVAGHVQVGEGLPYGCRDREVDPFCALLGVGWLPSQDQYAGFVVWWLERQEDGGSIHVDATLGEHLAVLRGGVVDDRRGHRIEPTCWLLRAGDEEVATGEQEGPRVVEVVEGDWLRCAPGASAGGVDLE